MSTQEILKQCSIEGKSLRIPQITLDRKEFTEIEKVLTKAGAKKVRGKDFRFDFPIECQSIIDKLIDGDKIDIKKEFQFFATPKHLAERMVQLADLKETDSILEPSAGQGAILDCIPSHFKTVFLFELNEINCELLKQKSYHIAGNDFLEINPNHKFDKIIANPPFSKNSDCLHVLKMYEVLADKGRIVTLMSNHWRFCNNKKETEFREWLETLDYSIEDIEEGTFKESGTNVATCLLIIDKK